MAVIYDSATELKPLKCPEPKTRRDMASQFAHMCPYVAFVCLSLITVTYKKDMY
jgi:hypothetical protein